MEKLPIFDIERTIIITKTLIKLKYNYDISNDETIKKMAMDKIMNCIDELMKDEYLGQTLDVMEERIKEINRIKSLNNNI